MYDEAHAAPPTTGVPSNPGTMGGTFHAAISNSTSGDITMIGCTTTTNLAFTATPTLPSDFRMIPFGDIDLRHELRVDYKTGVVILGHKRACVPRVYSARVHGGESRLTVALYQGDRAEEEWKCDVEKYRSLRHPNIIQLWGATRAGGIYALLFHGDLIPFQLFVNSYQHTPCVQAYIYASCIPEFMAASNYCHSIFHQHLLEKQSTFWIRRSTGRLCAELVPPIVAVDLGSWWLAGISKGPDSLGEPNMEEMVAKFLTLEDYHHICWFHLVQGREITGSPSLTVNLGAVFCCSSSLLLEESIEIGYLPEMEVVCYPWNTGRVVGEAMEDGWTRFECSDILNRDFRLYRSIYPTSVRPWLSQANYIFDRLGITSDFDNYVFVSRADFCLNISGTIEPPAGFLFLSPTGDFQTGPSSFRWPECPAYWSLNPSGIERLNIEEATELGFPSVQLTTEFWGRSWDASVYAGLRQFHHAKGFDPESQDVARHLRHPLYKLSPNMDVSFGHVYEDGSGAETKPETISTHEPEYTPSSICDNPEFSDPAGCEEGPGGHYETVIPVTGTFKFLMYAQLALMVWLGLCWVREQEGSR